MQNSKTARPCKWLTARKIWWPLAFTRLTKNLFSPKSFWYKLGLMKKRSLALAIGGAFGAAVAVKLLTRAATVEWDDVSQFVAHSEHSHFINVGGARVHYQEFGESAKPPIILIHGYTASTYVWKT